MEPIKFVIHEIGPKAIGELMLMFEQCEPKREVTFAITGKPDAFEPYILS